MISNRPLRVAIFAPHFAEYATRLATALSARADILLITETKNFEAECTGLGIGENVPQLSRAAYASDYVLRKISLRGALQSRRVRAAIRAFQPDLLHIQEQGDTFTTSIALEFSPALPIVLTVHDPVPHIGNDAMVAERFADGLTSIRAAASAYHVHGAQCEGLLRRVLRTSKPILATAHGVILVPPAREQGPAGRDRYLLFGRMEAYKGIDTLLDAIDLLPPAKGMRFVLAGRGPELERHRDRIHANPAIELIDKFLPPVEAIRQFQRARAVVVPYRDATQSGVISAAFGNGRPVIASRVGGLVDAVTSGTNGLLVPPDDPEALAAAIRTLADDDKWEKLMQGAKAAAAGAFAWSTIAAELLGLYAETLAADASGRATAGRT